MIQKVIIALETPDDMTPETAKEVIQDLIALGRSKCAGATKDPIAVRNLSTNVETIQVE
jgi:hypothetical protein